MVIWPVTALRLAAATHRKLYDELAAKGSAEALVPQMMTRAELYETIRYFEFEELDKSISGTVLPGAH
jgi:methylisocitrate lyase